MSLRLRHVTASLGLAASFTGVTCLAGSGRNDPPPTLSWVEESAVVGGRNSLRLEAPPGKRLAAVIWEIEGASLGQMVDEHGFTNTPLPSPLLDRPPGDGSVSVVGFFWDGRGGSHSIRVLAEYTDGTVVRIGD